MMPPDGSNPDLGGSSFLPALLACVAATEGPVLEIGIGHTSTPALHAMCYPKRLLVSMESDPAWREMFKGYQRDKRHVIYESPRPLWDLLHFRWGVVFIDDAPGSGRGDTVRQFLGVADSVDFIVVHDAQSPDVMIPIEPLLPSIPHKFMHKRYTPWTLVLSMTREIPEIP